MFHVTFRKKKESHKSFSFTCNTREEGVKMIDDMGGITSTYNPATAPVFLELIIPSAPIILGQKRPSGVFWKFDNEHACQKEQKGVKEGAEPIKGVSDDGQEKVLFLFDTEKGLYIGISNLVGGTVFNQTIKSGHFGGQDEPQRSVKFIKERVVTVQTWSGITKFLE
jgi:hypothetical protein